MIALNQTNLPVWIHSSDGEQAHGGGGFEQSSQPSAPVFLGNKARVTGEFAIVITGEKNVEMSWASFVVEWALGGTEKEGLGENTQNTNDCRGKSAHMAVLA